MSKFCAGMKSEGSLGRELAKIPHPPPNLPPKGGGAFQAPNLPPKGEEYFRLPTSPPRGEGYFGQPTLLLLKFGKTSALDFAGPSCFNARDHDRVKNSYGYY